MFVRITLTLASLVTAGAGALLADCELGLIGDDFTGMCSSVASYGLDSTVYLGAGLVLVAVLALVGIWVPAARPGNRRRELDPDVSLRRNLERLNEVGSEPSDTPQVTETSRSAETPGTAETPRADAKTGLLSRLEALEMSLGRDGGDATREVTEQWMLLLRRANDLHNRGDLGTDDFKEINTRLLDLFTSPVRAG